MSGMEVPAYIVVQSSYCATLLVCIFLNVNFATVLPRLLYVMFIIHTSRI